LHLSLLIVYVFTIIAFGQRGLIAPPTWGDLGKLGFCPFGAVKKIGKQKFIIFGMILKLHILSYR